MTTTTPPDTLTLLETRLRTTVANGKWITTGIRFFSLWTLAFLATLPAASSWTWQTVGSGAFAALMSALSHVFPNIPWAAVQKEIASLRNKTQNG